MARLPKVKPYEAPRDGPSALDGLLETAVGMAQAEGLPAHAADIAGILESIRVERRQPRRAVVWVGAFGSQPSGRLDTFNVYTEAERHTAKIDGMTTLVRVEIEEGRWDEPVAEMSDEH